MIITQVIGLALLSWAAGRIIYNIFFHPLRTYPGPLLNRSTPLPRMYYRLTGRSPFHTHALHQRYGKVVRLSPNELSFIDGDAWKDIYGHGSTSMPRDQRATPRPTDTEPAMISIVDDEEHRHQRQIFAPAFSNRALKEQEPLLRKHVELLVQKLHEKGVVAGQPVDMTAFLNFTTFDIMGDLAFGAPLGLLARADYTPWLRDTFAGIKLFSLRASLSYYLPLLNRLLPYLLPRSLLRKRRAQIARAAAQVHERLANETSRPDIWTLVLRSYNGENKHVRLTEGQMVSNASLFMLAGTETTATLLAGSTYLLATHPDRMRRLTAEIRAAFPTSPNDISLDSLPRLPYLNAVIEEVLRLYPPVPDGTSRRVPDVGGGARVAGRWVPADATVMVAQYAAFRSESNFRDAEQFLPERWLPGAAADGERFAGDERKVLQPFSVGPRNCLGMNLAYHEARLVLTYVLWHFDLELCKESERWMPDQKVFALWAKPPLMVRLSPVEGRW